MVKVTNYMRRAALVLAVSGLVACVPTFRNHGYAPTDTELLEVIVGVDSRASVEEVIGLPSTQGVLNESGFYYLSSRRRHFGARAPQEIDRQLVAISFDPDGIVTNIERFGMQDGRVVPLSRRVTDSAVQNTTFLRQLLGNIGNFDAARVLDDG